MPYFRKKPVVIEARQFTPTCDVTGLLDWINEHADDRAAYVARQDADGTPRAIIIDTLEGEHRADPGDWIIKGVAGEFYPCKPEIFSRTYEGVD